jgi:hypothetical protein
MIGCLRKVILLLVLLVLVGGAWLFRDQLRTAWRDFRGESGPEQPSQELADAAARKLDDLGTGEAEQVALSGAELESLLRYTYAGALPTFLEQPRIELVGDQLRLRARVPMDKLPRMDGLPAAAAFLPDTAELMIAGKLIPLSAGRVGFAVDNVSAAQVPLPGRLVPPALQQLGRRDEPGLPQDAIGVALPGGVSSAYIRRDSLVLHSRAGAGNE